MVIEVLRAVLRIHLILMRIRILDPHWKKWIRIRIQVIYLRFTEFFEQSRIFKFVVLLFFAYFYAKTWWTIQKSGNFYNLSFSIVHILVLRVNIFFAVFGWYFAPWIRIFVRIRIRIQESKIFWIWRIQILNTVILHCIYDA